MSQEVTPQFAIDYLLDDCEDCPEHKDGECVTESHCFEVKRMCIKALRCELILCKDCEYWEKAENSLQGRCCLLQMYPTGEWFCGNGKRKENKQ